MKTWILALLLIVGAAALAAHPMRTLAKSDEDGAPSTQKSHDEKDGEKGATTQGKHGKHKKGKEGSGSTTQKGEHEDEEDDD